MKKILSSVIKNRYLIIVLLLASLLRLVGNNPGYNQYHSDEPVIYSGAVNMIKNDNFYPGYYYYGALPITINSLIYRAVFIPVGWLGYYSSHILDIVDGKIHLPISKLEAKTIFQVEILGERDINAVFWSRYITALFGIGCVYLTYLLGLKVFNKKVGLLAALFLVFNFKHVVNSHLGLPDIYNSFFLLLSMLFSYQLWEKPNKKNYLLAGIFVGISFSVKYQFYALLPFALAHLYNFLSLKRKTIKELFNPYFIAGCLMVPIMFLLFNPYYFVNLKEALYQNSLDVRRYALGSNELNLYPLSFLAHFDYGYPQIILFILGLTIAAIKNFKKTIFLFVPYALFIFIFFYYSRGGFFVRSAIGTTPLAMLFVAFALVTLFNFLEKKILKAAYLFVALGITVFALYLPAKNSLLNVVGYSQKWTFVTMHDWMKDNFPKDQKIAVDAFDVGEFPKNFNYMPLDFDYFYSRAELEEMGAKAAVYNLFRSWKPFYFWMNFGFKDLKNYWNKPVDIMENMYPALVVKEMIRYRVFEAVKFWQAPDMDLILTKFPKWSKVNFNKIAKFTSTKDFESWTQIGEQNSIEPRFHPDNICYDDSACIVFEMGGVKYPTIRYTSNPIVIKGSYLYQIEGFMRTEKILKDVEREGFLRIDFYDGNNDIEKAGMASSVSGRVFGTNKWVPKKIVEKAPDNAKYMTISFQAYNVNLTKIWFDNVTISESDKPANDENRLMRPFYLDKPFTQDLLFPNSHGNL